MGHDAQQYDSEFEMLEGEILAARSSVLEADIGMGLNQDHSFKDMWEELGWNFDENAEPVVSQLDSKLSSYSDAFFKAIAPFVKPGSYITMIDQDMEIWRWKFTAGRCRRQEGTIVFLTGGDEL